MTKAIIYDFDGTLTPDSLPKYAVLEKAGLKGGMYNPDFLKMSEARAQSKKLDLFEAMTLVILDTIRNAGIKATADNIALGASTRQYNPGVEEFLRTLQVKGINNYILSSGAKDYLDRTKIAPYFKSIYASTLQYDENGEASGIERVMTIPQKAKSLAKIAREVNQDENDCSGIVYVGDGPTDLHAMQYIKDHGGKNILVYYDENSDDVMKMRTAGIVDDFVPADFRRSGKLWQIAIGN